MTWREGVHLTGTPIWCDARRRRDVCFVSSADRVGAGHGQLIATPQTLALIGAKDQLAAPVRRPFTLGTLRLELIPSGRGIGAAALHVDAGDHTVLYAGPIRTTAQPSLEGADVRAADAVVVASPLVEDLDLPALPQAAEGLAAWARGEKAPVIAVDSAIDGLEIATWLASLGIAVAGSRVMREAAQRAGMELAAKAKAKANEPAATARTNEPGATAKTTEPAATAHVLIKLDGERAKLPPDHALRRVDATTWPFVASDRELLAWIEQTRAKQVFVTGAGAERIVAALGPRARVLGPPRQMSLFR